ncbi:hypothetical protein ES332_D07G050700v1 [Gossypium tomentosum]|uniref:Endoglucanase n=1 Tax=Gossypium tomentosum TaxID=34277 RepID=A0A5D2K3S2_GOSTO|nr:hypothetical protein ES332_D07G050700v1 [Gossypium tomentosum]
MSLIQRLSVLGMAAMAMGLVASHDYGAALTKSILFYEGQRSGKLPPTQRITWRKDSALRDGFEIGVDLVGGYYDAGDNVKFTFPMAFSITMLAWSLLEFGQSLGTDLQHSLKAIQWGTDYLLKATSVPGFVFAQVGDPYEPPYAVSKEFPGSEVSAEIAAALAASSMVFRPINRGYSARLLKRARMVFEFADKYRGSYNDSLGPWACPFYCDYSGYQRNYVLANIQNLDKSSSFAEFGWDTKHAGINVLLIKSQTPEPFITNADKFVCSVLPESPTVSVSYSPGGLLIKPGGSNLQHATALSFLLLVYSRRLSKDSRVIHCGNVVATPARLIQVARSQVDYILGSNPLNMSYIVGYSKKFPERIHHRGSSLPSITQHPQHIDCTGGATYFYTNNPNPNLLTGAVVGGPDIKDSYADSRADFAHSEPTTYINAPLVGLLAYFKSH